MALTKIIPRLHAALPIGRTRNPAIEALYVRLFFAYKKYFEDPFAALAGRHPELFRGGHILDVGANAGYTATVFARAIEPQYRVFAFEPEPLNIARMRSVLHRRRLANVEVVAAAVGDRVGSANLMVNPVHPGDHRIATTGAAGTIDVAMTTVDTFVESRNLSPVAFVKIDVQGFELPVSRGMVRLIDRTPRLNVAFEYVDDEPELLEFYRHRGFELHALEHRGELLECTADVLGRLQRKRGYADILASRR